MLRDWVSEQLGAIARPDDIRFADNLPKTRSGKIMRRLLRAIARNEDFAQDQDLSTLENPGIIDQLRGEEPATAAPAPVASKPAAKAKAKAKTKAKAKAKAKPKAKPAAKPKAKAKARFKPKAKGRPVAKLAARKPAKKFAARKAAKKRLVKKPKARARK